MRRLLDTHVLIWALSEPAQLSAATRAVLESSGFTVRVWRDVSAEARQWFAALRPPTQPPKLGLHLLLGPDFRTMSGNFGRNVIEGRVGLLMAVCEKT